MKEFLEKAKISPLHTHTTLSIMDGVSTIEDYIQWCLQTGAPGLGVTDHGWAIGGLELYKKCKKAGITPLPGVEFYVMPDAGYHAKYGQGKPSAYMHCTAWATTEAGYRNLLKLASISWNESRHLDWEYDRSSKTYVQREANRVKSMWGGTQLKPRITIDELLTYNAGIVLGSGCLIGMLSKGILNGEMRGAAYNLNRLMEVYKDRLFMEIMPHACSHDYSREKKAFLPNAPLSHHECTDFDPTGSRQVAVNNQIIKMARANNLPLLLTIDSHFVKPEQKKLQDVILSNSDGGWTFYDSYHMYDTLTAAEHWAQLHGWDPEQRKIFQEAVENNDNLVNMAKGLTIDDPFRQPEPNYPIELRDADPAHARKLMLMEAIDRHGRMKWDDPVYTARLQKELDVICDNGTMDFSPYFLFLEEVYRWAAENSVFTGPGRGSGAGCMLAYCLKITHLDPIKWNLPFERFLSPSRIKRKKWPDLDCDFGSRDLVIAYLREKYGDKMAQCSTLGTLKLKSAIKDACRAILGRNAQDPLVDAVCRTIPNEPQGTNSKDFLLGYQDQDGNTHPGHLLENPVLDQFFKQYPAVYEAAISLLGIPRSVGRHASAFLISNAPISDSVPTCVISGYLCTQYQATASNNMVEGAGLIKFDFLTVNTLRDIENCIRLVQNKYGHKTWTEELTLSGEKFKITRGDLAIDLLPDENGNLMNVYDLPEDAEVFKALSDGKTETVFQMNSALMTGFTKRIRPSKMQHLSDIVALVRPGPLLAETGQLDSTGKPLTMTEAYIAVKNGFIEATYAHEGMKAILEETYGCAAYQEQLQQMFVDLAGYDLETADYLRETLAKKKRADMEKAIPELRSRLKAKGWNDEQQDVFVSLCIASSAYSFNKAHSAAYATVAYICAYLKTKHPIEWWTAVLQNAKVEDIREKGYAQVLQKDGILQAPSVNGPTDTFRPENGQVYAPLYLIERVGDSACGEIERARRAGGDFKSFQDFFERVDLKKVNEGVMNNLILVDTFREIEKVKTPKEILEDYHYFKKVRSLKLGEHPTEAKKLDYISKLAGQLKKGEHLKKAVEEYKAKEKVKGIKLDVPELFKDLLSTEIAKSNALPIYRLNVHEYFQSSLTKGAGVIYGVSESTIRDGHESVTMFKTVEEIKQKKFNGKGAFAGLVQSQTTFQYTDKKSGEKVTANKIQLTNDGESIEAVIWPDLYTSIGNAPEDKMVVALGKVREGREPGKYEMSVSRLIYV